MFKQGSLHALYEAWAGFHEASINARRETTLPSEFSTDSHTTQNNWNPPVFASVPHSDLFLHFEPKSATVLLQVTQLSLTHPYKKW